MLIPDTIFIKPESRMEKLIDLRIEINLKLEELAEATGQSRSALGSYETNEDKVISYTAITTLAEYYKDSTDYLLGLSENREHIDSEISDLHLDDETISILIIEKLNNRLLCEVINHKDFWKSLNDTEIYIDSLATTQIRNLNDYVATMRAKIQMRNQVSDTEHYIKTLRASEIEEDDYFSRLIGEDITVIAKDLKEIHKKERETSDNHSPLSEAFEIIVEFEQTSGALKKTLVVLGRQLDMNNTKMDPCDLQAFTNLCEKYSNVYKRQLSGRGKSKQKY